MAFKAGAIVGEAYLDTKDWDRGIKNIDSSSKTAVGVIKNLTKAGFAALAAGITASVYQANEYQKEFANVSTLTNQNTEGLQKMSLGLLSLSSELGSTRELTRSMYDAISAGATPGKQALDVVASSAKFAKAALADNAASVKLLSATMNAYGNQVESAEVAADVFFTTIKDGVITGEELAATIGQSIPLFASMKIPVQQLASGMAAMTKQGVNAAEATTQLNAIVNAFLKPSEKLTQVLKEEGFESGQMFIQTKGLTGALELLQKATGSGNYEIADLTQNIRAMKGVLALSGEGAKIFKDTLIDMGNASGAVNVAFGKQEKTLETLQNEVAKSSVLVGNLAKFFVDDLAIGALSALRAINDFILSGRAMTVLAGIMDKVGGAFNFIKQVALSVYEIFEENLRDSINEIKSALEDLVGPLGDNIGDFNLLDKSLKLVAISIKLIGLGINIAIDSFRRMVNQMINIVNVNKQVGKAFVTLFDVMRGKAGKDDVINAFSDIGASLKKLGTDFVEDTVDAFKQTGTAFKSIFEETSKDAEKLRKSWETGAEKARDAVINNYNKALSGVKESNNAIEEQTQKTTDAVVDTLNNKMGAGLEQNKTLWGRWKDYVAQNLKTFADKAKFAFDIVMQFAQTAFSGMSAISSQYYENENAKLELEYQQRADSREAQYTADQAALDTKYNNALITEEQYNEQSEALKRIYDNDIATMNEESAKKKNDLAQKQFKNDKALAITQIWMNLAGAIMGFWLAFSKIPGGRIIAGTLTGIATGIAVAQTALVARQKFVPQYAEGTDYHQGGAAIVGERGPEMINIPRGTQVYTAGETRDLLENEYNGKNITLNINSPVIREENDIKKLANAVSNILGRQLRLA